MAVVSSIRINNELNFQKISNFPQMVPLITLMLSKLFITCTQLNLHINWDQCCMEIAFMLPKLETYVKYLSTYSMLHIGFMNS